LLLTLGVAFDGPDKIESTFPILLAGDPIDKGPNSMEVVRFILNNKNSFKWVRDNHVNFTLKYLEEGGNTDVPLDIIENFFDMAHKMVKGSKDHQDLIEYNELAYPFLEDDGFILTHAPCETKCLGKVSDYSARRQRNFRQIREKELLPQLGFLFKEAVWNHPLHIFGHLATIEPMMFKNKIGVDTGCVNGNKLTALWLYKQDGGGYKTKFFYEQSRQAKDEELPSIKPPVADGVSALQSLDHRERSRVYRSLEQKINFISGTLSPADKTGTELETLESALNYYIKRDIPIVLQPKYMGSRCQIYLNIDPMASLAFSRNGYPLKPEGIEALFTSLATKYAWLFEKSEAKVLMFDGELMPWSAIGKGLIDRQFKLLGDLAKCEHDFLSKYEFEKALGKVKEKAKNSGFFQSADKKDVLIEKFGSSAYLTYRSLQDIVFHPLEMP